MKIKIKKKRVPVCCRTEGTYKTRTIQKIWKNPYEGSFEIVALNNNGSARLRHLLGQGAV